jgi:hypothetical protein
VLRAQQTARAGERDVDGFGGQHSGGFFEQRLDECLERVEALADLALLLDRRGFEPRVGELLEPALLAAQPFQAEVFYRLGRVERWRQPGGLPASS